MRRWTWLGTLVVVLVFPRLPALEAQSLPARPYDFSFTAVEGAGGYLVEVRDPSSGKIVVSHTIKADQTTVSLNLVPGPYELRLTTLNRLQHAESATDWVPIHVAAAGPPAVNSMAEQTIVTGKAQSVSLTVQGLASDAVAAVKPPSGAAIQVAISWSGASSIEIHIPALSQPGDYKVILTNPPDLSLTLSDKLTVEYPPPIVTRIDPTSFEQGDGSIDLHIEGQDFSPEIVVDLKPITEGTTPSAGTSNPIPLSIAKSDAFSITAKLPPSLGAGSYGVEVANASNMIGVNAGTITIVASAKAPTMTIQHSYGSISVQSQAAGKLYLDGKLMGALQGGATAKLDAVETGSHMLLMQYDDGEEERESTVVNNGEATAVSFSHAVGALPAASIDIKGSLDQWKNIPPALVGTSSLSGAVSMQVGNLYIDKIYLAGDTKNLYMKFDIKDDTKSSFFHQNNFTTGHDHVSYGVSIAYGDLLMGIELHFNRGSTWKAVVYINTGHSGKNPPVSVTDDYVMKGSTVVAAFPLKPIRDYLGSLAPGRYYQLGAYIWYLDGNGEGGTDTDSIRRRPFTF
jgi:hypothetical protein